MPRPGLGLIIFRQFDFFVQSCFLLKRLFCILPAGFLIPFLDAAVSLLGSSSNV